MSHANPNELLKRNSRSFYLTLRALPRAIRPQISIAYLLARTTDTIADTEIVSIGQRLEALDKLRERILGISTDRLDFAELTQQQGESAGRWKEVASCRLASSTSPQHESLFAPNVNPQSIPPDGKML